MEASKSRIDKKRGIANVSVSIAFKILILIADVLVRRYLINYIGNGVNGLNSLFQSILNFLSVAELGVGSAITFCMYKPIVDGDENKVAALYRLFTKLYIIIGAVIAVGGCIVMPLLPYIAKDHQNVDVNIYLTFGLMLISVVLTYTFSSKTSLINAYKNNYITSIISSLGQLLQCGLQVIVLIFTRSFIWYLVCRIIAVAVQWGATEIVAALKHKKILRNKQKVDDETKKAVSKNVKAMFMHKIGSVLVNTADSIIISAFIGLYALGSYTNYTTIMIAMTSLLNLCFTPLTSVIGHMFVQEDKSTALKYHSFFHTFNFVLGVIFFLGYFAVIDNVVVIFYGQEELELSRAVSFVITLNYFIQFMRQSTLLFRDATGTFYNDRWKPLFEGLLNIGLSIGFVFLFKYLWGESFAVVGVIAATIITNIFICHIVEPHVLHKYALETSTRNYYIKNYVYMAVFTAALVALYFCHVGMSSRWAEFFVNGFIAIAMSIVPCIAVVLFNKDFRHYVKVFSNKIKNKLHGKKVNETEDNQQSEVPEAPAEDEVITENVETTE